MNQWIDRSTARRCALSGVARLALLALALAAAPLALAQVGNNVCDPGEFPDVIVGDLHEVQRYGTLNGITGYSVGTVSCNIGTCWLNWLQNTSDHPVIGQSMYRLKGGRFEQIGQSWLKHGFFALSGNLCFNDCIATDGEHLGVHCSDPYSASLNGQQANLGPKYDVNASTGLYNFPFPTQGQTGDTIYKRLQVRNVDLDPTLNAGASYLVQGLYVSRDDTAAVKHHNNASWRRITVSGTNPTFNIALSGSTVREAPALMAWRTFDPSVTITDVYNDGRFIVGAKATNLGGSTWHYEYAVQNLNSFRSAGSFRVPLPLGANVTNVGFHDVDYHSGEPWSGADWTVEGGGVLDGFIKWSTEPASVNINANAIRWDTTYNFRFDADVPPSTGTAGTVLLGMWRTTSAITLPVTNVAPTVCDSDGVCELGEDCTGCAADCSNQSGGGGCCGDGTCNPGETPCSCADDCGSPAVEEFFCGNGSDDDCDGLSDCADGDCCADGVCSGPDNDGDGFELCDCNDANNQIWSRPGEVEDLLVTHSTAVGTTLTWTSPLEPGATAVAYEALRSQNSISFVGSTACLADPNPSDTSVIDTTAPPAGALYHYLVRATNACPGGDGPLGSDVNGVPRSGNSCP